VPSATDSEISTYQDPNERRRLALAEIDKAPFTWAHVRLVVVTGVGFFTDAYSVSFAQLATRFFLAFLTR